MKERFGYSTKGAVIATALEIEIVKHIGSPRFADRPAGEHEHVCQCGHPACTGKKSGSLSVASAPDDTVWVQ